MSRLTKAVLATALIAAAFGLIATGAFAGLSVKVPSRITIKSNNLHFTGRVSTPKYTPCAQRRKVTLYKAVSGGPGEVVGRGKTDLKGNWSITPEGSAGISLAHFYAKVKWQAEGTAGPIYICKAARSKVVGAGIR